MKLENDHQNSAAADPLLRWRHEFPILQETVYMVSNSLGAMPRGVYDSLRDYADVWASRGVRAWGEGWWDLNIEVGNKIAGIIGAAPGTVSIHQNISIAQGILLSGFDFDSLRNKVVIEGGIFPSVYYVLRGMLPPHIELCMIESEDHGTTVPVEKIIAAIDERTLMVPISHVLFRSAYILDVNAIIEKAHAVGAIVILDGYHAAGIVPFNVRALEVDFYLGGVLKWMCGGPGGVFLYARPDYLKTMRPRLTGWMAHQHPFDFAVDEIEFRDDAFRFLNGTPAVASLYAIQPGIDIITEVGVENIRKKSMRQTAYLIELAEAAGYEINTPRNPHERGGTVVIDCPNSYEVSRELIARNILVEYRVGAGKFYDISRTIAPTLAVWPGDTAFSFEQVLKKAEGASVNLTTLTLSAHTGSHADAPYHYDDGGAHPAELPIEKYVGRAHVVTIGRRRGGIVPEDFAHADLSGLERLLVHTWVSDLADHQWPDDFPYPTVEFVDWLADRGVVLLGVDMPSVDRFDDTTLVCHHRLHEHGIVNLETLYLASIPDGVYELIALPLKIAGVCGSPVRAVVRRLEA
jgi:kynureninase